MKTSILLLIIVTSLFGCSNHGSKYSGSALENPYVKIKIDDSYKYIASDESNSPETSVSMGLKSTDFYSAYAITDLNNNITSGIIVKFRSPMYKKANWLPSIFKPGNFSLESGITLINGINFKYSIFASPMSLAGKVTKTIVDSGYILPDTILVKNMKEVFGQQNRYLIDIYYFEDISGQNYGYSWRGPELIGKKEKTFLLSFDKRAKSSFRIFTK